MGAHQIMTQQVITIAADAPIVDAANSMLRNHISGIPVVDEAGRLVGIVSQGDFIRRAEIGTQRKRGRWLKFLVGPGRAASDFVHERGRKVGEIMTSEPYIVTEDATLEGIVELMERNNVKRLPVMRGDRLKRFPADLSCQISERVKDERIFARIYFPLRRRSLPSTSPPENPLPSERNANRATSLTYGRRSTGDPGVK